MKKLYYIIAFFVCSSCGDGVDLPSPGVETDLYKLPVKENLDKLMTIKLKDKSVPMIHCGALHTPEDIAYIKERLNRDPWKKGYETYVQADVHSWIGKLIRNNILSDSVMVVAIRLR